MRKIFYSDGRCEDDGVCDIPDMRYTDFEYSDESYSHGRVYRRHDEWGHKRCHDCICEVCGCRDMTVECREGAGRGESCLIWIILAVLTGGLALIFPLLRGGNNSRTNCVAICRRCGHCQQIC